MISFFVIDRDGVDPMPSITPAGFQFLLMDIGSQVWYFMLQYLDTVEVRVISLVTHNFLLTALGTSVHDEFFFILQARGMDLIDCLSFLFQLSFSTLGKVCQWWKLCWMEIFPYSRLLNLCIYKWISYLIIIWILIYRTIPQKIWMKDNKDFCNIWENLDLCIKGRYSLCVITTYFRYIEI